MCFVAGFTQEFAKLIKDLGAPKLGLSSVGGDAGASVANSVGWEASTSPVVLLLGRHITLRCSLVCSDNGTLVVYGNMSTKPHAFSLETLVVRNIKIQGFSLNRFVVCSHCSVVPRLMILFVALCVPAIYPMHPLPLEMPW
jgi:hypothetical protein